MNELTPLKSNTDDEDGYAEEPEWSRGVVYAAWIGGIVTCIGLVYLFAVYLPKLFIPEAVPLNGIVKVSDIDIKLKVLSAERVRELKLDKFKFIENDDKEDDDAEDDNYEDDDQETDDAARNDGSFGLGSTVERIILVGDVHGEYDSLKRLMSKLKFDRHRDHLLFLGDFISKGPDSLKVLDWAIDNGADCILGNHEYYVLQNYAQFHNLYSPSFIEGNTSHEASRVSTRDGFNSDPEYLLAKKLQPRHVRYINSCPVIKRLGRVPYHKPRQNNGTSKSVEGVAVHAGLKWDLLADLNEQDPMDNLEMRKLLPPFYNETTDDPHVKGAVRWTKIYKQEQRRLRLRDRLAVYYGHDARSGLRISKYTKGLDSRCNAGGHLTAMVLWKESETSADKEKAVYREQPFQVSCRL